MKILFLLWSALAVSIDSFFCGLTISHKSNDRLKIVLGITLSVFILCLVGGFLGGLVTQELQTVFEIISGGALIAIGFSELMPKKTTFISIIKTQYDTLKKSICLGMSIGVDGAIGCFSLVLGGFDLFTVILSITGMHILFLYASFLLGYRLKNLHKFDMLPPILLTMLGGYKLLCAFI